MSGLGGLLLANALWAGLMALGAWAASRRLSRQTLVHGLWVIVLVKLVTPPILPLPLLPEWSVPSLGVSRGPAIVVIGESDVRRAPWTRESWIPGPLVLMGEAVLPRSATNRQSPTGSPRLEPRGDGPLHGLSPALPAGSPDSGAWALPMELAWLILVAGALAVAAMAGRRIARFRRLLRHGVPAPPALRHRASELAARVGVRRAPEVRLLPARVPPMLWPSRSGPLLLLPEGLLPGLTAEEMDTLLVHELAHVRRRDHWVRLLELAVTVLFWWYPVTWWVRRALRRAEERCCDEWVLRLMPGSAEAYAEGLLKSLDHVAGEPDPLPVGASGAGPVHDLETRLKEILMSTPPTPRLGVPARLALSLVALLGLAVFPTQAQSPGPEATPILEALPRESSDEDGGLRVIQERQRMLEVQRRTLHQTELRLTSERMARESAQQREHLQAEAEQLRAAGETERAELVQRHGQAAAERLDAQRRAVELEGARLAGHAEHEAAIHRAAEQLHALEAEGREAEAAEVRREIVGLEQERAKSELVHERQQLELELEVLEAEHRARAAEVALARETAERDRADLDAEIERENQRMAWEKALQERELAAREAELALQARELTIAAHEAAGEHAEAEALRRDTEEQRQHVEAIHRGIQEEHVLRSTSDLEEQMESQLETLRQIRKDGAADDAEVQREIRRLEAGLQAMRAAGG